MAQQIAQVIARDLPVGPSWLVADGTNPVTQYDEQWCGNCHAPEYAAWRDDIRIQCRGQCADSCGLG